MKILLSTYSAETHSSYGMVTRELWKRLRQMNPSWEILQHGWLHRSLEPVPWSIIETRQVQSGEGKRPDPNDKYGQLSFESVVQQYRPDVVWTISDPYMCDYMGQFRHRYHFKLVKHIPVDGVPQPPEWGDALKDSDLVVPVTEFGAKAFEPLIGTKNDWIYHGVDTDRFSPYEGERGRPETGAMTRNTFVLGFVGHSQWRKQNWNMFMLTSILRTGAFSVCETCGRVSLAKLDDFGPTMKWGKAPDDCEHCFDVTTVRKPGPQDVALWHHTFDRPTSELQPSRLKALWNLEGGVIFTTNVGEFHGLPDEDMPALFRFFDAYLALSGGEGFCIPIIEAFATGIPAIYTDYSGHGEIGAYGGLPVKSCIMQPNTQVPINRSVVDMADAVRQTLRLIEDKNLYQELSAEALRSARDTFSWDLIAQQWSETLRRTVQPRKHQPIGVNL